MYFIYALLFHADKSGPHYFILAPSDSSKLLAIIYIQSPYTSLEALPASWELKYELWW